MKSLFNFFFKNQTLRQTVAKNTFWLFVGQVLGRLLRAVIIIYAARVLGAGQWGVFSYAMSIVAFLTIFTDLGINATLTKETARLNQEEGEKKRRQLISTSFFIKLGMICLSLSALLLVAPLFSNIKEAVALFPIMGLILVFDNLREFGFSITRALEKMEVEAFFFLLTNALIVIFGFWLMAIKPTAEQLAYAYVLGTGLGMIATFIFLRSHLRQLFKNFSQKLIQPILTSAWPFAMLGVMGGIMINTDTILLGWLRTIQEVGYYAAAQKPIQALYVLPTLLSTSLFPALSRLAGTDDKKVAEIINNCLKLVFIVAIPIVLIGIILGPEIISLTFGKDYQPAVTSWQILIATLIFIFPGMIIGNAIFAYDQQKLFIKVLALGVTANIILDLVFIPIWGGPGSAIATLIVQFLINIFLWVNLRKANPLIKFPNLIKIFGAAFCLTAVLLIFKYFGVNFVINGIFSGLIYLIILFLLKEPILGLIKNK